jgi:hypothetical protein
MRAYRFAQTRLGINSLQSHQSHKSPHTLGIDVKSIVFPERLSHPDDAVKWPLGVLFVNGIHDAEIIGTIPLRNIVV